MTAATVGEWLAARTPPPPPALRNRIREAIGVAATLPIERAPEACLVAAERLVALLLRESSTSRESALDLLTADALVTYAFEAAGEAAGEASTDAIGAATGEGAGATTGAPRVELAERASAAIRRIASLGAVDREGAMA